MGLGVGNRTTGELMTASIINDDFVAHINEIGGKYLVTIDAGALVPDLTSGCEYMTVTTLTAGQPLLIGCGFSGTVDNYAQFRLPMPKSWNASTVSFRVRWTGTDGAAGDVQFRLQALAAGNGDSIDQAYGGTIAVTDTYGGAKIHHITDESAALAITGTPQKQDMVYFRLWRNATNGADTKIQTVYVEAVELFISTDAVNDA